MKIQKSFLAAALSLTAVSSLLAGENVATAASPAVSDTSDQVSSFTNEFNFDTSYVGDAGTTFAHGKSGHISEQSDFVHYVISKQIGSGPLLRLGAEYQRYSYGLSDNAPLPNTMQSVNLVIGADAAFAGWLIRVEAYPGFYTGSTGLNAKDFNVPFIIGGTYIVNENWQWIVGIYTNVEASIPVLPAIGVRWKISDQWTLDAIPPRPRLEYALSDNVTLYAGGDFKYGTYRTSNDFGNSHNNSALNNAVIDYTEIRAGVGVSWKLNNALKIDAEAGSLVYRSFDFYRADRDWKNYNGAPYGQIAVSAQF